MIIKTFTSESVSAALKAVRQEMGGDAVVLKTQQKKQKNGSRFVEVTACLDKPSPASASQLLGSENRLAISLDQSNTDQALPVETAQSSMYADNNESALVRLESKLDRILIRVQNLPEMSGSLFLEKLSAILRDVDVDNLFVSKIVEKLSSEYSSDEMSFDVARKVLSDLLQNRISKLQEFKPGDRVMFFGPAGAGKTSLLGKVAAHLVAVESKKVRLVTLDSDKVGALDEIQSYAELLSTESNGASPNTKINSSNDEILLVDTPSITLEEESLTTISELVERIEPTRIVIVFSAMTRSSDIRYYAESLNSINPTDLAVTMLDLTKRWGGLITATEASNAKLTSVTDSPSGIGEFNVPDPMKIAAALIPEEDEYEHS